MRVLITGGAGLLGAHLARELSTRGCEVVSFDVANPVAAHPSVIHVRGSVVRIDELLRAMKDYSIDVVVHMAFLLNDQVERDPVGGSYVNAIGTVNVLEAASLSPQCRRVVLASSASVYGDSLVGEARDETAPATGSRRVPAYSTGKLYLEALGHMYWKERGLEVVGLRPSTVYGTGRMTGTSAFVTSLIESTKRGERMTLRTPNFWMHLVHVDDVAAGFAALVTASSGVVRGEPVFYNTGADDCYVAELSALLGEVSGVHHEILWTVEPEKPVPHGVPVTAERLRKMTGFERRFTPLKAGILHSLA